MKFIDKSNNAICGKISNSTKLRFMLNESLQQIKNEKIISKELVEDIRFIIFDYLDTMENNIYGMINQGESDEYL